MKSRFTGAMWKGALVLATLGILTTYILLQFVNVGPEVVSQACATLRQQGHKTELSQFNFSTPPEMKARLAPLLALVSSPPLELAEDFLRMDETMADGSMVVIWSQDKLKSRQPLGPNQADQVPWDEYRPPFDQNQAELDALCAAAMSGPIAFDLDASHGSAMRLPHLSVMKRLLKILGDRAMIDLHYGESDEAWTNLMAATCLVTKWEPEPTEPSHLVRFAMATALFDITWQALQATNWPDDRLAQLQAEWAGVDFFKNLPETGEFWLACDTGEFDAERNPAFPAFARTGGPRTGFGDFASDFAKAAFRSPLDAWSELGYFWTEYRYYHGGQYEEEKDLLFFDRDREVELRAASQAATWKDMVRLPGVTNPPPFTAKYHFGPAARRQMRQIGLQFQRAGGGLLGRAAEAETERRILVVATALERRRAKLGSYPSTLAAIAPHFLKTVPADYMDGQPLRYQVNADGHYRLYSVGLDCVDDGGTKAEMSKPSPTALMSMGIADLPQGDIVWPFPAPREAVAAEHRRQMDALRQKLILANLSQAEAEWQHSADHQAGADNLLAAPYTNAAEPKYRGRPASEWLCNGSTNGGGHPSLGSLLTLKPVTTGKEPEEATFELPINFDALKRVGEIYLLVDANNDDAEDGCVARRVNYARTDGGNTRLTWETIYESPGKHALRAGLEVHGASDANDTFTGPPLAMVVSNLCQFSTSSEHFDRQTGAAFLVKLPELNGQYVVKCQTTNGVLIKTLTGSTKDGILNFYWDLSDENGQHWPGDFFNSVWTITLPDSGRTQHLWGP